HKGGAQGIRFGFSHRAGPVVQIRPAAGVPYLSSRAHGQREYSGPASHSGLIRATRQRRLRGPKHANTGARTMSDYRLYCFAQSGNAYKVANYLNVAGLPWQPYYVDFFNG